MTEPIQMLFGGQTRVGPRNHAVSWQLIGRWHHLVNTIERCCLFFRSLWPLVILSAELGWAGLEKVRFHLICCVEDDERYTFCGVVFV